MNVDYLVNGAIQALLPVVIAFLLSRFVGTSSDVLYSPSS